MLSARRLAIAGAALVVLAGGAAGAWLLTRDEPKPQAHPVWVGAPLATDRGTATELQIVHVGVTAPERVAAQVLDEAGASFTKSSRGNNTLYKDGEVEVRVRKGDPTTVVGLRAPASGEAPGEQVALEKARAMLVAFGLDPDDWTATNRVNAGLRTVQFSPKSDLPSFSTQGVTKPFASAGLDARGIRSFFVALTRFEPREVPIMSQQEAWPKVDLEGRFEKVRLVLVDAGKGEISPYWEFESTEGKKYPVHAVLTA